MQPSFITLRGNLSDPVSPVANTTEPLPFVNTVGYVQQQQQVDSLRQSSSDFFADPVFYDHQNDMLKKAFNECYETLYPFQKEVFLRSYQKNSIIYLPTGAGKTVVASALVAYNRAVNRTRPVVFVVNRIPLITQQANVLRRIANIRVAEVCGEKKDARSWSDVKLMYDAVVIMDSVCKEWLVKYPVMSGEIGLLILDEVHHARKNGAYACILKSVHQNAEEEQYPVRVIGLSASPAARESRAKTKKSLEDLMILARCQLVTVINCMDDLERRVNIPSSELYEYRPSPMEVYFDDLLRCLIRDVETIIIPRIAGRFPVAGATLSNIIGTPYGTQSYIAKTRDVWALAVSGGHRGWRFIADFLSMLNMSLMLLEEASLLEMFTHVLQHPCVNFVCSTLFRQDAGETMTLTEFSPVDDLDRFIQALASPMLMPLYGITLSEHQHIAARAETIAGEADTTAYSSSTKMRCLFEILNEIAEELDDLTNFRGIVFCETKAATAAIQSRLAVTELGRKLKPQWFVGHGKSLVDIPGTNAHQMIAMTDAQQRKCLQAFRDGDTKLLIATSVAEEGLDIPICSLVVRYEGVFSVQSFIQSRGRARRHNSRFVVISKLLGENPCKTVLEDIQVQEEVVREICMMDQDRIIQAGVAEKGEFWESDPLHFLAAFEERHRVSIFTEEFPGEVFKYVEVGPVVYEGSGVGTDSKARAAAAKELCKALYIKGYILPNNSAENTIKVDDISRTVQNRFQYIDKKLNIAFTRERDLRGGNCRFIEEFREAEWTSQRTPFFLLEEKLRDRKFGSSNVKETFLHSLQKFEVSIDFGMMTLEGQMVQQRAVETDASRRVALETAALRCLRCLGEYAIIRPSRYGSRK